MVEPLGAERLWELTVEHSPVGMTLVDPDGTLLSANRALCTMLRCTEADLIGTHLKHLTHPDDLARHLELYDATIAGERSSYRMTKRCVRADGSTLWGDLSVALVRDDDGHPLHLIGQILDVSEARDDQERLVEALALIDHQRLTAQAILDTVDLGLLLIDGHGRYESWNRRHGDILALGYPDGHHGRSGQIGHVYAADGISPLPARDLPSVRAARGEVLEDVHVWLGSDPETRRAFSVSARPVLDAAGRFAGAAMGFSDITELMRALRSRDEFLATVSHELRTPLTAVLGYLEMLTERDDVSAQAQAQLQVVQRNSERLLTLVSDLLRSAHEREGNLVLTRSATDVGELARAAVVAATPNAVSRGLELEADLSATSPMLVDGERLRQVVDNLLSNAIKYTDAGGRVELRVHERGAELELEVSDTGIGIHAIDLDRIFTPFFQTRAAQARFVPGVGLGLGIARTIVAAHGGVVEISSEPDVGTTVRVRLPRVGAVPGP